MIIKIVVLIVGYESQFRALGEGNSRINLKFSVADHSLEAHAEDSTRSDAPRKALALLRGSPRKEVEDGPAHDDFQRPSSQGPTHNAATEREEQERTAWEGNGKATGTRKGAGARNERTPGRWIETSGPGRRC